MAVIVTVMISTGGVAVRKQSCVASKHICESTLHFEYQHISHMFQPSKPGPVSDTAAHCSQRQAHDLSRTAMQCCCWQPVLAGLQHCLLPAEVAKDIHAWLFCAGRAAAS